jgi:hypothetical protein
MKAEIGKRYRHWKGNEYTVLAIARLESDPLKEYVVYRAEYESPDFGEGSVWLRERSVFEEQIETEGKMVERFCVISNNDTL